MTKACSSMRYWECGAPHVLYHWNVNTQGSSSYFEIPLTDNFGRTGLPLSILIHPDYVDNPAQLLGIWCISAMRCITSYSSGALVVKRPATPDTTFRKLSEETLWRCDVTGECIYHVLSHSEHSHVLRTPDGLEFEFPQLANSAFVNAIYVGNGAKVSITGNVSTGIDFATGSAGSGRPEFKVHFDFDANNGYTLSSIAATRVVDAVSHPAFQAQFQWVNNSGSESFCLITVLHYPFEENGYSVSERYLAKFVAQNNQWRIERLSYLAPENTGSLPTEPNQTPVDECVEVSGGGAYAIAKATLGSPTFSTSLPIIRTTYGLASLSYTPLQIVSAVGTVTEGPCFWLTDPSQDFPAGQIECEGDGTGRFEVCSYDGRGRLAERSDPFYMNVIGSERRSLLKNGFFDSSDLGWRTSGSVTMVSDDFNEPSARFGNVCARLIGSSWIQKGLSEFPKPGDPLLVAAMIEIPSQTTTVSGFVFSVSINYENLGARTLSWEGNYQRFKGKGLRLLVIPVDGHYPLGSFTVKIGITSGTVKVKAVQVFAGLSCHEYYYADADARFPNASAYAGAPTIVDRDAYGNSIIVCSDQGNRLITYMDPVSGRSLSLPLSQKDELGFGNQTSYTNLSVSSNSLFFAPVSSSTIGTDGTICDSATYSNLKWFVASSTEQGTLTTFTESAANKTATETSSPYIRTKQFSTNGDLAKLTFGKTSTSLTSVCDYSYQKGFLDVATLENSMQYDVSYDGLLRVYAVSSGGLSGTNISETNQFGQNGEVAVSTKNDGLSEEFDYDYQYDPSEAYETSRTTKAGTTALWTWQTQYNGYDFIASVSNSTNGVNFTNAQVSSRELSQTRYHLGATYWGCSGSYDAMNYGATGKEVLVRNESHRSYHQGNGILWEKATKAEGFYSFVPTKAQGNFVLSDLENHTISPTGSYSLTREMAGFGRIFGTSQSAVSFSIDGSGTITTCFVVQMPANTNKTIAQITWGSYGLSLLCHNGYLKFKDNLTGITATIAAIRLGDWESIVTQLDGSVAKIYASGRLFEIGFTYALSNASLTLNAVPFRAVAVKRGTTFSEAKLLSLGVMGRDLGLPLVVNDYVGFRETSSQFPVNSVQKDGAFHHLGKALISSSVMSASQADCFAVLGDDYVPSALKSEGIAYAKNVEFNEALDGFGWRCFGPTVEYSAYGTSTFTLALKTVPFDIETSQKRVICTLKSSLIGLTLALQNRYLKLKIGNNWISTGLMVSWGVLNKIALSYATSTSGSGYSTTYQLSYTVYCNGQSYSGITNVSAQNNYGRWVFGGNSFLSEPFYGLIGDVWACKKELSNSQLDSVFGGTNEITKVDLVDSLGRTRKSKTLYNGSAITETTINYVQMGQNESAKPSSIAVHVGSTTPTTYFGYDANYQLNQIDNLSFVKDHRGYVVQYGLEALSYDTSGNPTLYTGSGFTRNFSYYSTDLPNRLHIVSQGTKSKEFTYSGSYPTEVTVSGFSNLSSLSLSYSGGLLLSAAKARGTASYVYGPDGFLCRSVSAAGEVSHFAFDENGRLLSHSMQSRTLNYLYGNGGVPYAMVDSVSGVGKCYAIVTDGLGRIMRIVDPTDGSQAVYSYDLWGVPTLVSDSTTSGVGSLNRLLWKGYLYDADLGCYCLGRRHYDPFALRFLEPDGIPYLDPSLPGGANPYLYCLNDPVNYTDQTGRIISVLIIGLIAGAIVGAAVGGTYGGLTAAAQGKTGWEIVGAIGIGIVAGGIMGAGAGFGAAVLTFGIWGFAAYSGIAWGIGLSVSAGTGAIGGFAMDTLSQVMHEGKVNDWQSVGWSVLQGAVINTISMLSTTIGGGAGSSWSANIGLNVVMGFPVSGISFTLDMLRYYVWTSEEEKERRRRPKAILVLPWKA